MREQNDRITIADTDQIGLRDRSVQSDEMNRRLSGMRSCTPFERRRPHGRRHRVIEALLHLAARP